MSHIGLNPPPDSIPTEDEVFTARDRLLQSINEENDLPALGSSVARVVQLASSDDEAVRNLAYFVLSDVALTQKVLRVSNTVAYRAYAGVPITTISKAIFMLGFDTVKTCALAMLLVESMSGKRAACVRFELSQALTASIVGRELARRSHYKDAEEAAVAALFKNMGRLLVAAHDAVLYNEIVALIEDGSHTPAQASTKVLGCSFDLLAESVLRDWEIPDTTVNALSSLPKGVLRLARTRAEWMQQVAAFSVATAELIARRNSQDEDAVNQALLRRFGIALNFDQESLVQLMETVVSEADALSDHSNLDGRKTAGRGTRERERPANFSEQRPGFDYAPGAVEEFDLLGELSMSDGVLQTDVFHPSGKPINAGKQLMTGVQDVTEMMASGRCKVNDLIMLVLETIYRSMGFRFATICLKDPKTDQYRARISLGEKSESRQAGFTFPVVSVRDLFNLAMENNADLMISDAFAPKIRELIPAWHRSLLPDARSFIILPLVVQKKPFGFFYADRTQAAPEGVPPDETALIRTLKGQVLAALAAR